MAFCSLTGLISRQCRIELRFTLLNYCSATDKGNYMRLTDWLFGSKDASRSAKPQPDQPDRVEQTRLRQARLDDAQVQQLQESRERSEEVASEPQSETAKPQPDRVEQARLRQARLDDAQVQQLQESRERSEKVASVPQSKTAAVDMAVPNNDHFKTLLEKARKDNDEQSASRGLKAAALYEICLNHFREAENSRPAFVLAGQKAPDLNKGKYQLAMQFATETLDTNYSTNDPNMNAACRPQLYYIRAKCKFLLGGYDRASIMHDLQTAKNLPEGDSLSQRISDILVELRSR